MSTGKQMDVQLTAEDKKKEYLGNFHVNLSAILEPPQHHMDPKKSTQPAHTFMRQ
jgi:hypothetical protein